MIGTNDHIESEAHARRLALNSLRKRGELPPIVKNVIAKRFSDLGIFLTDKDGNPVKRGEEFKRLTRI